MTVDAEAGGRFPLEGTSNDHQRPPSVENELRTLLAAFDAYRHLPGPERSGETPKKLVQVPLQEFFARGLPGGSRGGDGDRPPN
jgi:hypothetical protein